jgi:putative peptidoglycan lipid II flippase
LIEVALLGWQLKRLGMSLLPRWYGMTPATRQVLGQYWPMLAAAFLMGSIHIVSQSMAAMLDPGSVSALSYGNKVTTGLLGIGATAVSTAFLPHFSRMVAAAEWDGIRQSLLTYTGMLLVATIPVTVILTYWSEPVVALLFQRGAFTEADTKVVGEVQAMYLLQVPVYLVSMLFVRFVTAIRSTHVMVWGNVINLAVCVALTYVLMKILGVVGIALASSVMYLVSCGFLAAVSFFLLRIHSSKPMAA